MQSITTTKVITDAEVWNAEAVRLTTLIQIHLRTLNCFARMRRPINLDPLQRQCQYSTNSCNAPETFLSPSSAMSIDDAPFCRFFSANNNPTTKCLAHLPQLCATSINRRKANLPFTSRCRQWCPSNWYHRRISSSKSSSLTTERSIKAAVIPYPLSCKTNLRTGMSLKRLQHWRPRNTKRKDGKDGNPCPIGQAP